MDLEKRVEILETELEILKAEIQATLLAIQEQMLSNTFPWLRADQGAVPQVPARPSEADPAEKKSAPVGNKKQVKLDNLVGDKDAEAESEAVILPTPSVRKPIKQIKLTDNEPSPDSDDEAAPVVKRAAPNTGQSTKRSNPQPVVQPTFSDMPGHDDGAEHSPVFQTPKRAEPERPAPQKPPRLAKQESREVSELPDWTRMAQLETWFNQHVAKSSLEKTREFIEEQAAGGFISADDHKILLEFLNIRDQQVQESTLRTAAHPTPGTEEPSDPIAGHDSLSRTLVLKLMAGIQNIGTSTVKGQKNNGQGNNNRAAHRR